MTEQTLLTLAHFRKNKQWDSVEGFVKSNPTPYLVIEFDFSLKSDTGEFWTTALPEELPEDQITPHPDESVIYIAPVVKSDMAPPGISIISLGRSGQNDIVIRDEHISKVHCYFKESADGEGYHLSDPGSKNGTWLDGNRLEVHTPVLLKGGEKLRVGRNVHATFYYPDALFDLVWPD